MRITLLALAVIIPTLTYAGDIETEAQSQSNSGVYIGGTTVERNTPSMGNSVTNSTAPCVVGKGFGVAVPGMGISSSNGRIDGNCETLQEAKALQSLLGNRAAIAHLCKHNKDMQATLVDLGVCYVVKRK